MTQIEYQKIGASQILRKPWQTCALVFLLCVYLFELVNTAWISDDAGITLRTVINFLNGFGPRFNVDERVQGYTHPLWFLLISSISYFFGNVFYVTFLTSIALSLFALWIVIFKIPTTFVASFLAGVVLILSKSYLDFSTSGLESPLSHLLIATIVMLAINLLNKYDLKSLVLFLTFCSLLYLNRADLVLLVGPLAIYITVNRLKTIRSSSGMHKKLVSDLFKVALIASVPILIWTTFSVIYYGFPFPNTAYAKLATGIPLADRVQQGQAYFTYFAQTDPMSLIVIFAGILLGFIRRNYLNICISIGILLYLVFILSIGGDFMGGRFFAAPLLMATIQITQISLNFWYTGLLALPILIFGSFNTKQTIFSGVGYSNGFITSAGVGDERGFYYQQLGLLTGSTSGIFAMRDWSLNAKEVQVTCGGLGFKSLQAGPGTHFIDTCALTDPLLSRLPTLSFKQRIGHFVRALPPGYTESVADGKNLIEDKKIHDLYDTISLITRENLFSIDRFKQIVRINLIHKFNDSKIKSQSIHHYEIALNEKIFFKKNSKGSFFLRDGASQDFFTNGWGGSEDWGVWAIGSMARLSLPIPTLDQPRMLYLDVQIFVPPSIKHQTVEVYKVLDGSAAQGFFRFHNGRNDLAVILETAASQNIFLSNSQIAIPIDKSMVSEGRISLEFKFPTPVRPRDVHLNNDVRELTMGLISAVFK